jgi:hypothetical protein
MTRDEILAFIDELEGIIRKQLGEVGVLAVRPALRRVAAKTCDKIGVGWSPDWSPDEILTDKAGRRFVDAASMARECQRHGVDVDHRFLSPFGHVPTRMYTRAGRIRVWSLPD